MITIIKQRLNLPFLIAVFSIIFQAVIIYCFTMSDNLILLLIALFSILFTILLVILLKLNTVTLSYLIFIPTVLYILTYQLYMFDSITANFNLMEDMFLGLFLIINMYFYKKDDNNYFVILPETIIIAMLVLGNLITFINLRYSGKVFILSTHNYLRYFLISLIVLYSEIDFKTFVKVMRYFSLIMIINAIASILQFIFGEVFLAPFVANYYYLVRNGVIRCIGIFPWSTELGTFSGIFFIVYYFLGKYLKNKYFYFISSLCLLNILLSQSRLAFLVVIIILFFDNIKSVINALKYLLIIAVIFTVINSSVGFNTIFEDFFEEYFSSLDRAPRIYYTIHGIDIFKDYPIFGIGFDRYGTRWIRVIEDDNIFLKYDITKFGDSQVGTTDSFIAKLLPETGLFGTALFLSLFVLLFFKAWKIKEIDPGLSCFFYIILYSAVYLINSAHSLFSRNMGPIFWISAGFVMKYYYIYFSGLGNKQNHCETTMIPRIDYCSEESSN